MQSEALKPCPFCGGQAERVDIEDGDNSGGSFVHCTVCDASGNIEFEFKENFISNWNRRAALEAALSAAEPRGYLVHDKDNPDGRYFKQKPSISDDDMSEYEIWIEPLYAAPPAPSVAVKALADAYKAGFDASSQGYNGEVFPEYEADNEWLAQRDSDLSALSAQVQEVAGWHRLDDAFSNFINGYGDPYEPKEAHEAETAKNLKELYEAFTAYRSAAPAKQEGGE